MWRIRDRVQPVERVGHQHQPVLSLDPGDRLGHRQPALDLLGQEEADHLALGGLDLLARDHGDRLAQGGRLQGAVDLVVVGDRDRAQATRDAVVEQRLGIGGAVVRVAGVHVQVDVDQLWAQGGDLGRDGAAAAARGRSAPAAPPATRCLALRRRSPSRPRAEPAAGRPPAAARRRRMPAEAGRARSADQGRRPRSRRSRSPTHAPPRPAADCRPPLRSGRRPGTKASPGPARPRGRACGLGRGRWPGRTGGSAAARAGPTPASDPFWGSRRPTGSAPWPRPCSRQSTRPRAWCRPWRQAGTASRSGRAASRTLPGTGRWPALPLVGWSPAARRFEPGSACGDRRVIG